ncbi:hypothetical protein CAEBREN_17957 [Caenorhabditis brenneri]|uniref:Uncharacterized protein n=1 Tax=Caenorhabditis brenneri TaxID=135651 RepID=G0N3E0_CAEBE|nr:hypothetical protein CAEBREN_17957 [Caenorhabditis brenneri]
MERPPKQHIRKRRAKKEPKAQNEPCKNIKLRESSKKVKIDNPYRVSIFYQKKQLRSMRYLAVLFIGLTIFAMNSEIDPGLKDGVKALLLGFLSAATTIEHRTNSNGKRGEKHNSYFFMAFYFMCFVVYDNEIEKYRKVYNKYKVHVLSVKLFMQMIGGFAGVYLIKENEYVGGIFGSFVGLVGSAVVGEKYNWFSQYTVRR